jgi:hypothetical protein
MALVEYLHNLVLALGPHNRFKGGARRILPLESNNGATPLPISNVAR